MVRATLLTSVALALAVVPSAHARIPAGNLVVNPGAEADTGSTEVLCGGDVAVSGWEPETGRFTAVAYGADDQFPSAAFSAGAGGGANLFSGGCTSRSGAEQTIDLSAAAPEIDGGLVVVTLSALIGGLHNQNDTATVEAFFLGAAGQDLRAPGRDIQIGPVPRAERTEPALARRAAQLTLPVGTRRIRLLISMRRATGNSNNGYVDNVSLTLVAPTRPEVGRAVVATEVAGVVTVKCPGRARTGLGLAQQVRFGCDVDATRGGVAIASARNRTGAVQSAIFAGGAFRITQTRAARPVTELRLSAARPTCTTARSASSRRRKRRPRRRLFGTGSGSFRTLGAYGSATVRGTRWLTEDRCEGTLFRVSEGRIVVRSFALRRSVTVRAGRSFLAPARR